MKDTNVIKSKTSRMVAEARALNSMYADMDKYHRNEWTLPAEMKERQTTYKAIDTGPHNALNTATKILSHELPNLSIQPLGPDIDDKNTANKIERVLMWQLMNANKRAKNRGIIPDVVRSALRYDRVCINVVHLPSHYEALKTKMEALEDEDVKLEALTELQARQRAALKMGDFGIYLRNPQSVFSRHDDMGLESIVLVQTMLAQDIYNYWGEMANYVKTEDKEWGEATWRLYDYTDIKERMVWVGPVDDDAASPEEDNKDVIMHVNHGLPFIPWVDVSGGTMLDGELEFQCKPFLESVYRSKSWETLNVIKTLVISEVIRYAGAPRHKDQTVDGEGVPVEYGGDDPSVHLRPGQDWDQILPPDIDRALTEVWDRAKNELNAQTNVQILQDMNFPAGTAYASINAVLQTAIASLQPYKSLAESALADLFEKMLQWVAHTGRPLVAYGKNKSDKGEQYTVSYDKDEKDFDPDNIYLTVELDASAPTDRTERINAAIMLYNQLPVAAEDVLTQIGYADPQQVMRNRTTEDMVMNEAQLVIRQRQAEAEMQLQQMQMMMQQAMQEAMQPQQQGGMEQQGQPPMEGLPAFEGAQGIEGFNPAQGGISPAVMAPGMTREEITGTTRAGEPTAEI